MTGVKANQGLLRQEGLRPTRHCRWNAWLTVARMGSQKLDNIEAAGADTVVSADLGCLLHLQGLALRQQRGLTFRHLSEALADADLRKESFASHKESSSP